MMRSPRSIILLSIVIAIAVMGVVAFLLIGNSEKPPISSNYHSEPIKEETPPWEIIVPVMVAIVGLSFLPLFKIFFPVSIKNGVSAEATVLKVWDTGVTINNNPQVGMLLEVRPSSGAPFQAETKKVFSRLDIDAVKLGATVQVVYDPANPKRLLVQSIEKISEKISTIETRLMELKKLREKDLISLEEYEKKRGEIIKSL